MCLGVMAPVTNRQRHLFQFFHKTVAREVLGIVLPQLAPVDERQSQALDSELNLCHKAFHTPSFADSGARSGYVKQRLECRSGYFGRLALDPSMGAWLAALVACGRSKGQLRLHAFGGGPGFEVLGLAMVVAFLKLGIPVDGCSLDNEPGWGVAVEALERSCADVASCSHLRSCSFEVCDILSDSDVHLAGVDIVTFSYVCVENCLGLRRSGFAFLRRAFQAAEPGTTFVFLDVSPRLWPEIEVLACGDVDDSQPVYECCYIRPKPAGWMFVLRRRDVRNGGTPCSPHDEQSGVSAASLELLPPVLPTRPPEDLRALKARLAEESAAAERGCQRWLVEKERMDDDEGRVLLADGDDA